jgi:hypothetical protein
MDGWLTERGEGGVDGVVWVLRGAVSCFHFAVDEVRMVQMLHRRTPAALRCAALLLIRGSASSACAARGCSDTVTRNHRTYSVVII